MAEKLTLTVEQAAQLSLHDREKAQMSDYNFVAWEAKAEVAQADVMRQMFDANRNGSIGDPRWQAWMADPINAVTVAAFRELESRCVVNGVVDIGELDLELGMKRLVAEYQILAAQNSNHGLIARQLVRESGVPSIGDTALVQLIERYQRHDPTLRHAEFAPVLDICRNLDIPIDELRRSALDRIPRYQNDPDFSRRVQAQRQESKRLLNERRLKEVEIANKKASADQVQAVLQHKRQLRDANRISRLRAKLKNI